MKDHSYVLHDICQVSKCSYAGELSLITQYKSVITGKKFSTVKSSSKLCSIVSNE